jgi:hypothetical protein
MISLQSFAKTLEPRFQAGLQAFCHAMRNGRHKPHKSLGKSRLPRLPSAGRLAIVRRH